MSSYGKILVSFMLAAMLLIPILNRITDTGFLFVILSAALFVLSVLGIILKAMDVIEGGGHQTGEFLVVSAIILLWYAFRTQFGWEKSYLQIPSFLGIWVLALYFADTALFPGFMSLFERNTVTMQYVNMTAFFVMLMTAGLYLYSDDKVLRPLYVAGIIVAALVLAVNEAWGTVLLFFAMLLFHAVVIVPVADTMKRLLQLFFGLGLLFCNISLLVNYSGMIHIEGLKYRMDCSVVGELFLCLLALYVFKRWDKIPEEIDLQRIKLSRLQKGCKSFLKVGCYILVLVSVVSLIDGRLENTNVIQLFAEEHWERISKDVFVVALLSLFTHMNEALLELWRGNLFAVFYQMYGWFGATAALVTFGLGCYKLYCILWKEKPADDFHAWFVVSVAAALVFLPVTVYMLPVYFIPAFLVQKL